MARVEAKDEFLRRRLERQRKIRKRRICIFFFFFILILLCIGAVLCFTVLFPIEKINISGSEKYTAEQIAEACTVKVGDNLFNFTESGVEAELSKKLPYVEKIKIKRHFSGILDITVTDASEYACYNTDGKYFTVSSAGKVLKQTDSATEGFFCITGAAAVCEIGSNIEFSDEKSEELISEITEALTAKKIKTDYIDISDTVAITVGVEGRFKVLLGNANSLEEKINHLGGMLESIGDGKTGKINLSMWTSSDTRGTFVEGQIE